MWLEINSTKVTVGKLDSGGSRCEADEKQCQTFRIAEWYRHPNFKNCKFGNNCLQYDFLLIRIQKKNDKGIHFSPLVQPIKLAHRELRPSKTLVGGEWTISLGRVDASMMQHHMVHVNVHTNMTYYRPLWSRNWNIANQILIQITSQEIVLQDFLELNDIMWFI